MIRARPRHRLPNVNRRGAGGRGSARLLLAVCCRLGLAGQPTFAADASAQNAQAADHWAFRPIVPLPVPISDSKSPTSNPIDAFVLAELRKRGLAPSPEADRRTLIRRLCFDLIGLPPTPEEVEAFLRDKRTDAYEKVVDRLLASPHFGERWARHWLDVARFGESQGFEYDRLREQAWHYRDYVIAAFNADKPYDQFIREQIAGDVLEPVTRDGIVATGFLVAGPWDQAGSGSASPSVKAATREAELEDIIGTVAQTFLGLTLNCARCHDHKFDPIPQRDYYRVKAVFQGVRHGERSLLTPGEQRALDAARQRNKDQLAANAEQLAALDRAARTRARSKLPAASQGRTPAALPLARWSFERDARDALGSLHGTLKGGAKIEGGRLKLDGKEAFVATEPLEAELAEKTLEAWLTLPTLDQGGGGVITVETENGGQFDAIVFGEREPRKWIAGSDNYRRTRDLDAPEETAESGAPLHLAIVYRAEGSITVFREGRPYAPSYSPSGEPGRLVRFPAGRSRVLFGRRHTGGGRAFLDAEIEEARLYDRALTEDEVAASFRAGPQAPLPSREVILSGLTPDERSEHARLLAQREELLIEQKRLLPVPTGYVANVEQPELTFVLHRGEPDAKREQVTPGGLSAIARPEAELGLAAEAPEAERRRRFARWVASAENPLTARVIVNRAWHYHFGRGLVGTPNDFGKMGEQPSHPELLDWLARWFVAPDGANWSLKKLHRLVVTSATWRQSSDVKSLDRYTVKSAAVRQGASGRATASTPQRFNDVTVPPSNVTDSDNRLLWRFTPRRLEVEAVRDAMLALSGELNPVMSGPGFRAFTNQGNGFQNEYLPADPLGAEFNRRTVYRMCVHSARDPLLDSLDCPEFSTKTPVRPSTTTPLQALSMMNNSFVQRQAAKFAERVRRLAGPDMKRQVRHVWALALNREPHTAESKEALAVTREHGLEQVCWALLNANEFIFLR
jgi:hypothetical protein